ncbi:hypothetical protein GCM10010497_59870 [Streptomyces cinereoruber]|uniref:DUF5641 domain-containing protein n=1 Tax=Streptomyces cinereoruber TaxID=67260 RepID=A0AAV4KTI8_9ACTN|nr:hypothetical protein GCM10010497_59870 [Streptomyces cinereoruber]
MEFLSDSCSGDFVLENPLTGTSTPESLSPIPNVIDARCGSLLVLHPGYLEGQRWPLARVAELINTHSATGTPRVGCRIFCVGWAARRSCPRVGLLGGTRKSWFAVAGVVVMGKRTAQFLGGWMVFEDETD